MRAMQAVLTVALLAATPAAALARDVPKPMLLKMKRGSDRVTVRGVLRQDLKCCAYAFDAQAGQSLYWRQTGATARVTIAYPDGKMDGPGLPDPLPLPQTGRYVFGVRPNLMADGGFGHFKLSLRIPPLTRGVGLAPRSR